MTATERRGNGRAAELRPSVPAPGRLGQGTAVEQSRAVAEVQAAIVVAQQVPRDIDRAVRDMYRSCGQKSLAERSHYRFRRGKENVTGPTIQLARELARCWGNMQYGVTELRRDDGYAQSEMQAWAWDVQTNTRSSTTFIVPHIRDRSQEKGGPVALIDARDIYENNANMGARRLREMIFAIVPGWYTEDAIAACYDTLAGDPEETAARTTACVDGFAKLGVTQAAIEQKLGGPRAKWTPYDLAQLQVIYRSIIRGEIRKEDEFPAAQERVTAAEITGPKPSGPAVPDEPTAGTAPAAGPEEPPPATQPRAGKVLTAKLDGLLRRIPLGSERDVQVFLEWRCGGPYTATKAQAEQVAAFLEGYLKDYQGNVEDAASAIWGRYQGETGQDAASGPEPDAQP